jgi:hypothetical protein
MRSSRFLRFATTLATALAVYTTPIAFASASDITAAPQQSTMAQHASRPFQSFIPGASEQWCDSLAYPYCEDPGHVGVGPVAYADSMPARPIFGN